MDRFYPSSRTCGSCGYVYEHLDLRDRQWTRPQCGTTLDRDVNAATNIMRQGISWRPLSALPDLAFDHVRILSDALM